MPLKLVPPHKIKGARTYYIRGTHLGVSVFKSTGTDREPLAKTALRLEREDIERRHYAPAENRARVEPDTFADAAEAYLRECPTAEVARVARLLEHLATTPLDAFDKDFIDATERTLFPGFTKGKDKTVRPYSGGTLNREYRGPLAAVLHHAAERGKTAPVKVKKHKEAQRTRFQEPEAAARLIEAAAAIDAEKTFGTHCHLAPLLIILFTTGLRISEVCKIEWPLVNLERGEIGPLVTKNGEEYTVALGPIAVVAIANIKGPRLPGRPICGYRSRHAVKGALGRACKRAGMIDPVTGKKTFTMHQARHSFGTWLRRNGEDMKKMMELGRWKDPRSTLRYQHVAPQEHAPAIARLPLQLAPTPAPAAAAAEPTPKTRVKGRT